MRLLTLLLSLVLLTTCSTGKVRAGAVPKPSTAQYCAIACSAIVGRIRFNGSSPENPPCAKPLVVQSLFDCVDRYCELEHVRTGLDYANWTCVQQERPALKPYAVTKSRNPVVVTAKETKARDFTQAVMPADDWYRTALQSTITRYKATKITWDFIFTLYAYWALVFLIGALKRTYGETAKAPPKGKSSLLSTGRRFLTIPRGRHTHLTPAVAATISIYVLLCVVLCFPAYETFQGNVFYATQKIERAKYISNRLGTLALANLPLIWLFGIRNSPLLWVTAWPYSTFSQFHRWTARITTLLVVAHGVSYSITNSYKKTYFSVWSESYWRWGVVSLLLVCLLAATSLRIFRSRWYDAFLVTHVAIAATVLGSIYHHHNELLERKSYHVFIWICVATWLSDRTLRLLRVLRVHVLAPKVQARLHDPMSSDLLRVDMTAYFTDAKYTPSPGQYFFLYEPLRWRGWESHPFTLCSWTPNQHSDRISEHKRSGTITSGVECADRFSQRKHTFLIRPRKGFTKRLQDLASSLSTPTSHVTESQPEMEIRSTSVRLLLEGPYPSVSHRTPRKSDSLLFIAGGSGISSCISRLYHYTEHGGFARIHLVWAARTLGTIKDVCENELAGISRKDVEITTYVTSSSSLVGQQDNTFEDRKAELWKPKDAAPYRIVARRPDLKSVINAERETCSAEGNGLSIFCCGPLSMEMDCREAVKAALEKMESVSIDLVVQEYGW